MNKYELAKVLLDEAGYPIKFNEYENLISMIFNKVITEELRKGNDVYIPKFGKFIPEKKNARVARNPATGGQVDVPEKMIVRFRPSLNLKEAINANE